MIVERRILLGIQNFEQSRGWIAPEIRRHFINLVHQKDWIARTGFLHGLHDLAGQCADVRAPVAADFSFVR